MISKNKVTKYLIIGASNLDIQGISIDPIKEKDSNPGKVYFGFGGVGHNIAVNLGSIDDQVAFITSLGDDKFSLDIKKELEDLNLDISASKFCKDKSVSYYLAILDNNKDMQLAVNDMDNIAIYFDSDYCLQALKQYNNIELLIIDANLSADTLWHILNYADKFRIKVLFEAVSASKVKKIKTLLSKLYCLKLNKIEAQELYGYSLNTLTDYRNCAEYFLRAGLQCMALSLGADGLYLAKKKSISLSDSFAKLQFEDEILKCKDCQLVDTTGAGDAMTAGLAYAIVRSLDLYDLGALAMTMSYLNVQQLGTLRNDLNEDLLLKTYREIYK